MSFFKDMVSVFKKKELSFLESYKEADDVHSFLFEKKQDLTWKAGQYGLFSIAHKSIKNGTRPLSISSAPVENVVRITTRVSDKPSEFKKALSELQPGMKIKMGGPIGAFSLNDTNPSLLIAGGIGITPFRAMLKQIEAEGKRDGKAIQLLYLDSQQSYLFRDELDDLANKTSISITYLHERDDLHQEIAKFIALYKENGTFFVAGSKSLVEATSTYIQSQHISKRNIKKDVFFGY